MSNVFGIDIRRFSVLVIAFIILLAFFASFANINIKIPNNTTAVNVQTNNFIENYVYQILYKYVYNKTIVLAPSLTDLEYVRASLANTKPPYYNYSNTYIFFNFSEPTNNTLSLLLSLLSRNASEITPGAYGALLSIASSAYVNITNYTNTTLQPFPLNANDTENYSKWELIVKYAKEFEPPSGFQKDWSYPPSDYITVGPLNVKIINKISIPVHVDVQYIYFTYLVQNNTYVKGHNVYEYLYYDMFVLGFAYLYANNTIISSTFFITTFNWNGGTYSQTLYGVYYVNKTPLIIDGDFKISTTPGYSFYEYTANNYTYYVNSFYPQGPYVSSSSYNINFYEYEVTTNIGIRVINGTNPVTVINNKVFSNRMLNYNFTFTVWSYQLLYAINNEIIKSASILTYDHINIANYTINRTWDAGSLEITSQLVKQWNGNNEDYFVNFNSINNFTEPPPWIYQPMVYNKYVAISWFYLEQNASLAHTIYEYVMKTINKSDIQFWKFEYFVLASQFVMYTFNTTYSVFNNMLELESFYVNWSIVPAEVLNLSAWPKLEYFAGLLLFFNVSRIPQIYNNSIYMNITNNYEIYLVDVYNALFYSEFNKVPFGNIYSYQLEIQTIYFYKGTENIPYVGEQLYFYYANYVPTIYYAIFEYPAGKLVKITAIWNGTAWLT